ncbi:DUF6519 domain-containing protein [Rhizobium leguminosarum]|uniref:DUF6519 domain-containing protein n=1 Tax=Rhizobium leguminosarum TaxID=384 RepID=UPI00103CFFFC|nr:DUF6519 domain-containing protein [Rhizobium leguminosarum]NKK29628.1 hypothetical protein [Rhizobium leguminosarum bv. viciae]TBZ54191.1 hypothetical protein E0H42_14210 [Rhizobium leguminosarum bv. viciae]
MRIDVSADSFDILQGYSRVLLQQGRPILDRDWNEQTSIVLHQLRALTRAIYGPHGGPAGGECGFVPIVVEGLGIRLRKGWYSVDGLLLSCEDDRDYMKQKGFEPAKMAAQKTYLVYLEAIEREVTAAEQGNLLDSALPGVDVAARGQIVWRANHTDWLSDPKNPASVKAPASCRDAIEQANAWYEFKREKQAPPTVPFPKALEDKLKELAKKSSNQLLRAECHSEGIWKLSTDNAFALFEIDAPDKRSATAMNKITIQLGVLDSWIPEAGNFVELLTEQNVRFNEPGELLEIAVIVTPDRNSLENIDRQSITLSGDLSSDNLFRFVRVWNSRVEIAHDDGVMPGDYWQFASRDSAPDFVGANLRRPTRVYAPLALIRTGTDGTPLPDIERFQRIVGPKWREIDDVDFVDS